MPRTNKKTRVKQLPARLQLQQKDTVTSSYPSIVRLASDNRSGEFKVSYDDLNTINFTEYSKKEFPFLENVIAYYSFEDVDIDSETDTVRYFSPQIATSSSDSLSVALSGTGTPGKIQGHTEASPFRGVFSNSEKSLDFTFPGTVTPGDSEFRVAKITGSSADAFNRADPERPYTIAAWINLKGNPASNAPIFSKVDPTTFPDNIQYSLRVAPGSSPRKLELIMSDPLNSVLRVETSEALIQNNEWTHIVGTYDGSATPSGVKLFVNGEEAATTDVGGTYVSASNDNQPIFIGNLGSNLDNIRANIDELVVFDRALIVSKSAGIDEVGQLFRHRESLTVPEQGISYGIGLDVKSKFIKNREQTTDIITDGRIVKGVGDSQASFTPGQSLKPFNESNEPTLDGLSSNAKFYSEGSPVDKIGDGFNQPLWSKSKIKINLPVIAGSGPNTIQTFVSGARNTTLNSDPASGSVEKDSGGPTAPNGFGNVALSYPMAYYNFDNQRWEGVGRGEAYCYTGRFISKNGNDIKDGPFFTTETIGFANGLITQREGRLNPSISGAFEYMAGAGFPIANFGFPFDARYHATSSQQLKMSNFINEPFVVEKIVVDFSGAFEFSSENFTTATINSPPDTVISSAFPAAINNFFILVQREPGRAETSLPVELKGASEPFLDDPFLDSKIPTTVTLSNADGGTFVKSIRDVLTFGGVSSFAANTPTFATRELNDDLGIVDEVGAFTENPKQLMTRDAVFESNKEALDDLTALNWSGSFRMEIGSRNPSKVTDIFAAMEYGNNPVITVMDTKNDFGGRNGLGVASPSGRDFVSPISTISVRSNALTRNNKNIILSNPEQHFKFGGYILKPGDSLIFGWQQPTPLSLTVDFFNRHVNDGIFSTMTFNGARIVLYGSLLREGKEFHDTLNQLLTSEAVHEVIE